MRWKRYPEYRPSGVEWLDKIPAHWATWRFKFLLSEPLKYGANEVAELDDPALPRYIRITDVTEDGSLRDETFKSIPEDVARPYLLSEGDLLFARSGATVGKTFLYQDSWGRAAYAGYLIRARMNQRKMLSRLAAHFSRSTNYWDWLRSNVIQATIQNVSAEKYAGLFLSVPPIEEQENILKFLDRETARIDALIEKKRRQIELLQEKRAALISHAVTKGLDPNAKMRPSGIEWLGNIPAHWKVLMLKRLARIRYGLGQPPKETSEGLPLLRATNIKQGRISLEGLVFVDPLDVPPSRDAFLRENEILVVRSGAYTGDSAIVRRDYAGAVAGYDLVVTILKGVPDYFAWQFLGPEVCGFQFQTVRLRAAQPHMNAEELGNTLVVSPPLSDQEMIAEFLSHESHRIEAIATKVRESINMLREYRTALISAAVTGKIDVREGA